MLRKFLFEQTWTTQPWHLLSVWPLSLSLSPREGRSDSEPYRAGVSAEPCRDMWLTLFLESEQFTEKEQKSVISSV